MRPACERAWTQAAVISAFVLVASSLGLAGDGKPELGKEYPAPGEEAEFKGYAQEIRLIQQTLAKGAPIARGFHRKPHGCLNGTFSVLADRPAEANVGVFAETHDYSAIVRFSNASGSAQADTEKDMRGMAIKLIDVKSGVNQDFLMTNGPREFAKNPAEMMAFAMAAAKGTLERDLFFVEHLDAALILAGDTSRKVGSVAAETYWSRAPIMMGTEAIKFNATPCPTDLTAVPNHATQVNARTKAKQPSHASPTYLTDDLRTRAAQAPICFDFWVQFQRDAVKQPVEDSTVEWKEKDTPSWRVARLTLPVQTFDSTEQVQACEAMSFSPWHALLPEHQPIGNLNRARKAVYESSSDFRNPDVTPREPSHN